MSDPSLGGARWRTLGGFSDFTGHICDDTCFHPSETYGPEPQRQSQQICDSELIRVVYPRNTLKHLARLLNAPIDTARHLLYRRFSHSRRRELAHKLLAELNRQDALRATVRQQLEDMLR